MNLTEQIENLLTEYDMHGSSFADDLRALLAEQPASDKLRAAAEKSMKALRHAVPSTAEQAKEQTEAISALRGALGDV
jgi:hypothetical protein